MQTDSDADIFASETLVGDGHAFHDVIFFQGFFYHLINLFYMFS